MYDTDVKASQQGDKIAFARLIESNQQSMYRVAYAILQNDNDAIDAIQETIYKAYLGIVQLKRPDLFKTWLIRILINQCNYQLRQRKKVIPFDGTLMETKTPIPHDIETRLTVKFALQSLNENLRIVVILFYYENMSIKDMAKLLDIPDGTVKSRLTRARAQLAEMIDINEERGVSHGKQ